jgi:LEA14-like dessication related protein
MRKWLIFGSLMLLLNACSALSGLSAFTKCEFRLYSLAEPLLCGIDVSHKRSWTDFSFMEGQMIAGNLLRSTLPFDVRAKIEVRNPGNSAAAVNAILWKVYVDDVQVAMGSVNERVEIAPAGGRVLVTVPVHADLIDLLEGDSPGAMLNLALNLVNSGDKTSRVSLKIKPSVLVGSQTIKYPGYFTISREFSSGN